jgi:homoserine O-acetyltransferase/O-succinyltransferase
MASGHERRGSSEQKVMKRLTAVRSACLSILVALLPSMASAEAYPAPREGDWIAPSFKFHTGETLRNVRLHYLAIGDPTKPAVLVLHGTYQVGASMLTPSFAGKLFGAGQPLDATKYYIILPDGLGVGKSTKPSDGLRARFPEYDYADMVSAQYRMVTEGLGIRHLRLVLGNSMVGMQTWLWGEMYPNMMDALVPMASQPTEMSARNWMMRRMVVESIKQDPAWDHGNYRVQPPSLRLASVMFSIATNGGTLAYQALAPTHAKADKMVDDLLAAPEKGDANDFIYQWDASADYNAAPGLDHIQAPLLAINSADDERNPPETGTMQTSLKQLKRGRLLLIPASTETRGHGTTGIATFYDQQLGAFMRETARQ